MLELRSVNAYYGEGHILHDVSLSVAAGEVVSLLGRNGAGKTTTLLTIMGFLHPRPGEILWRGEQIGPMPPERIARLGIGFVPQERLIFPSLTVRENLTIAETAVRSSRGRKWTLARVFKLFPRLEERQANLGWQLSGGEQQMLAIGRALMVDPELLLLDEPSEGLAPIIIGEIVEVIETLKSEGLAVLLVEQNLRVALRLADRHHILVKGTVAFTGSTQDIETRDDIRKAYLVV